MFRLVVSSLGFFSIFISSVRERLYEGFGQENKALWFRYKTIV